MAQASAAVVGDEDWHIPKDLDTLLIGIVVQGFPLAEEKELAQFVVEDISRMSFS